MVFILFTINFWGVPVVFGEPREMSYPGFQSSWLQILHHLHLRSLEKIQFLIPLFWLRKNQTSGQITITTCILIYICMYHLPTIPTRNQQLRFPIPDPEPGSTLSAWRRPWPLPSFAVHGRRRRKALVGMFREGPALVQPWNFQKGWFTCYVIPQPWGEMNKV